MGVRKSKGPTRSTEVLHRLIMSDPAMNLSGVLGSLSRMQALSVF